MSTESYIVRVYRREAEDGRSLVGTIEIVETQEEKAFKNLDDLWGIIGPVKQKRQDQGGGRRNDEENR
jgi:hypothetical protein